MGREVRMVPKDWEHPRDKSGKYIPLHYRKEGWVSDGPPEHDVGFMPQWREEERTHYQMYENITEGTPISRVMESPEALAQWLVDNGASAFAGMTASYDAWLRVCRGGYTPTMVIGPNGIESGVDAMKG
jgi:hypothetical protein